MADFRRCIYAFAVVALLLGLLPTASAQVNNGVSCTANAAVPPTLRAEGLTELAGDIVLNCTGGTPTPAGGQIPQANIQIFYNTQVTSRLLTSSLSEAILTIDEPTSPQVVPCFASPTCPAFGAGPNTTINPLGPNALEFKNGSNPNVFQGVYNSAQGNSISFIGIPIDSPGTSGNRIYRITNVRVNANAVSAPGANGVPGQVIGLVSATPATNPVTGTTSTFAINNPQVTVAFVQTSLVTSVSAGTGGNNILQCVGRTSSTVPASTTAAGTLNFTEVFPTAFKTHTLIGSGVSAQNVLGLVYNSESGYYNPDKLTGTYFNAGLADYGTRLRAVFNNIPNGVQVFVAVNNTTFSATTTGATTGQAAQLVSVSGGSEATPDSSNNGAATGFTPVTATTAAFGGANGGVVQVPIVANSGEVSWEVIAANPLLSQTFSFSYYLVATASVSTNSPAVGNGTVNLWYSDTAPQAFTGGTTATTGPIPRFVDQSTAVNIVSVSICRTNILWPYVTSQGGFDTGLAIANTSQDPFGTAQQQGTCSLYFYGLNAPASLPTGVVTPAQEYTALATTIAPNFTGYVIALCNFQYAHGFAFISDVGSRNLAMGYLALIIPEPATVAGAANRLASPFECGQATGVAAACDNSGEELGN